MKKITDVNNKYEYNETKLDQSFQKACANEEFKDYVYSLNIKEDILKKYTSSLEDSFNEYKNCENCKNLENCKNNIKGYCYKPINDGNVITFTYDACPKMAKKIKEESYTSKIYMYELPTELKKASFKDIYKDDKARVPIIKYFKEFIDNYDKEEKPKGIYLNGSFGSGKTYLIAALFNEMAKKGVPSILVYYPDFLVSLKSSLFSSESGYDFYDRLDSTKRIPLLLLDDIGAEKVSDWTRDDVLGPILQYRMQNNLPTFFTSNLTIEELEKNLATTSSGIDKVKARRIVERIKQLTVNLELISKNRRN